METFRILLLNWRDIAHPEAGGAERDIHEFASAASRWGHDVTLFTAQYNGAKPRETFAGYEKVTDSQSTLLLNASIPGNGGGTSLTLSWMTLTVFLGLPLYTSGIPWSLC